MLFLFFSLFLFRCPDTVSPLQLEEQKFFHPSKDKWQRVPDRPLAWRLEPNSYIWVPSSQLLADLRGTGFPKEFTLFITLRLHNDVSFPNCLGRLMLRGKQKSWIKLGLVSDNKLEPFVVFPKCNITVFSCWKCIRGFSNFREFYCA